MKKVNVQFPKLGAQHAKPSQTQTAPKLPSVDPKLAESKLQELIKKLGMPTNEIVQMSALATAALQDKSKYPDFVKFMVDKGASAKAFAEPNLTVLTTVAMLGKVAKGMK